MPSAIVGAKKKNGEEVYIRIPKDKEMIKRAIEEKGAIPLTNVYREEQIDLNYMILPEDIVIAPARSKRSEKPKFEPKIKDELNPETKIKDGNKD